MIELRVPAQMAYRELATRAVAAACKVARSERSQHGGDPDEVDAEFVHEMVSAIGEAFNNVVIHGYDQDTAGDLLMIIRTEHDRLEVELLDDGASFDPSGVPLPDLDGAPTSGMGLFIIRSFVDQLTYSPGHPNSLVMIKFYRPSKATGELAGIEDTSQG